MDGECVCEGEYWFGKCISCWEDETMVDGICIACPPGMNYEGGECVKCPNGQVYRDIWTCVDCPNGQVEVDGFCKGTYSTFHIFYPGYSVFMLEAMTLLMPMVRTNNRVLTQTFF